MHTGEKDWGYLGGGEKGVQNLFWSVFDTRNKLRELAFEHCIFPLGLERDNKPANMVKRKRCDL